MVHDLTGQTLGTRYRFEALLGEGTFARVYRITDLNRRAALAAKVLRRDVAVDSSFIERFRREAEVLARLQHPNIVRYYGIVDLPEALFILMDYIPGQTLDTRLHLHGGPLRPAASLNYLTPLASALFFAHGEGVIHRDLKPGNVLVHENGTVFVTDFGIARLLNTASDLTLGAPIGTPNYMAPEQITGLAVTARTDIYALGVILYRMFAGRLPFRGESPEAEGSSSAARVTYEQVHVPPPRPTRFNPQLDGAAEEVVLRCLAKRPDDRFASVSDLYEALTEAVGAAPIALEDTGSIPTVAPQVKLPEWSQVLPPADDDTPSLDQLQPIRPQAKPTDTAKRARPPYREPPRERIEHPAPPPQTEPHLERVLNDPALTSPSLGRVLRRNTPAQPLQPAYTPMPGPPVYIAPPARRLPPRARRRRTTLWALLLGVLLVLLSLCGAALYLLGYFEGQLPAAVSQPGTSPLPAQLSAAASGPSAGAAGRGGQRIIFDSARDGDLDIFIMNLDGSGLHQLTTSAGAERGGRWSPDGSLIAYYAAPSEEGNYDIFVMNEDGTGLRNLTRTPDIDERYPAWSPDGTRLAYHSNANGNYDITVINVDGSGAFALTDNDADDVGPDWSPEGSRIAYHTDEWGAPYQLALVDVETREVRRLTHGDDASTFPAWSPDGSRIAYNHISAADNSVNIYLLMPDGGAPRALTVGSERNSFPAWSPDGQWIVFQRGQSTASAIYRIPAEGGTAEALTGQQMNFLPSWEPFYD